jgi:diguanylate cyclase (GGDEF)-like protein
VYKRQLYRTISAGKTWRNTLCNKAKSGRLYWVDTTIVPNRGPNGQIIGYTTVRFDVTPLKEARQDLANHAKFDRLTCALNRPQFLRQLNTLKNKPFHLAVLDLDQFKEVNDVGGHASGDRLLIEVAQIIDDHLGEDEYMGRIGADEFAIIFQNDGAAEPMSERLRSICQKIHAIDQSGLALPFRTASVGIARYPFDTDTPAQLIQLATLAVAAAKKAGGDTISYYEPHMVDEEKRLLEMRAQFFTALDEGRIALHFQSISPLNSGTPISFEALLRWRREDGSLWSPGDFSMIFHDDAVMREIGMFVVNTAIKQIECWTANGLPFHHIAINASGPDLRSESFLQVIRDAIADGRIKPHQLCVEITEYMLLDRQARQVREAIDQLHEMGVQIAFDDFGTGFASLTHLRELPIDLVKIDRSFVQSLHLNSKDRVIVESIIGLAHRLGLNVVAEGVELPIHRQLLGGMGCDHIQGYWVSKPLPSKEATDFIRATSA